MPCRGQTHACAQIHTVNQKCQHPHFSSALSSFFVIPAFLSLPCSHLLRSKITACYKRSRIQSLSLLIVGTLIHYISSEVPYSTPFLCLFPLASYFCCYLKSSLIFHTLTGSLSRIVERHLIIS